MPKNDTIFLRLRNATDDELQQIAKKLKLKSNLFLKERSKQIETISKALRNAAGNSMVNPFRDAHQLSYKQILIGVANQLKPGFFKKTSFHTYSETELEDKISEYWIKKLDKMLSKQSIDKRLTAAKEIENQLKAKGYQDVEAISAAILAGSIGSVLAANSIAVSLFSGGFWGTLSASLFGPSLGALCAGGGLVFTLPVGVAMASTPNYRKIIPVVLTLIQIRQRIKHDRELKRVLWQCNRNPTNKLFI